jgi:D-alanyl-D-alanine-carboxypeptidase/D-alanyl-D-alanine-endopeptidase
MKFDRGSGTKLDEIVQGYVDQKVFSNVVFEVYNSHHQKIYEFKSGAFDRIKEGPILSASKWISTATIMTLVDEKKVSLDVPVGNWLRDRQGSRLRGPLSRVTLRQLLAMTSGILEEDPCYKDSKITLRECAFQLIEKVPIDMKPGSIFRYGDAHLSLAGHLVSLVTGKGWQTIFNETMREPLGLQSKAEFYAKPKTLKGASNPRPAAGLRISYDDYLRFLEMIFDRGIFRGQRILSEASIVEMEKSQLGEKPVIAASSFLELGLEARYGLGQWLECRGPSCDKVISSSPGFYGFYPWIDRESGYYALFGAYEKKPVFSEVIKMVSQLKAVIETSFGAERTQSESSLKQ